MFSRILRCRFCKTIPTIIQVRVSKCRFKSKALSLLQDKEWNIACRCGQERVSARNQQLAINQWNVAEKKGRRWTMLDIAFALDLSDCESGQAKWEVHCEL